jgi:hypothetical protein
MNFYNVGGFLVRRAKRARRKETADVWQGDAWHPFLDLSALLRHGHRLTETEAITLLQRIHQQNPSPSLPHWSNDEARLALRRPRRPV